jgi:hypothetical protein
MSSSSLSSAASLKVIQTNNKEDPKGLVTITEKVNLTANQYEVFNIICDTYQTPVSEYMQEALVEAMKFDIEEGNFCDVLLDKIIDKKEEGKSKGGKNNSSFPITGPVENDLDNGLQF